MRVGVTGASGFVGSAAARALADAGHDVVGFGRRPRPHGPGAYRRWTLPDPLEDPPPVDAVLHCAATVDDWAPLAAQRPVTVEGTRRVLATWPTARFVHVSSASVYDPWTAGLVRDQDGPAARHAGPYPAAKAEAEQVVSAAAAAGREVLVLRPHAVHGPGDPTLLPRLLAAVRHGVLVVPGAADTRVHLTSVDTLARACVAAVEGDAVGVVNVADAAPVPLGAALDQALGAALGTAPRRVHLPLSVSRALATVVEVAARVSRGRQAPPLTRYAVSHLAVARELDLTRLRRDLGVDPPATDLRHCRAVRPAAAR